MSPVSSVDPTEVFASIHFTLGFFPTVAAEIIDDIERTLKPFRARPHWGKLWHATPSLSDYPRRDDFIALAKQFDPASKFSSGPFAQRALQMFPVPS